MVRNNKKNRSSNMSDCLKRRSFNQKKNNLQNDFRIKTRPVIVIAVFNRINCRFKLQITNSVFKKSFSAFIM